ncbi:MAG: TIGR03118 family protein [Proteobacteria bacterium]|nr:TIGR03118 family protein [Pseudomonadota bacterium]
MFSGSYRGRPALLGAQLVTLLLAGCGGSGYGGGGGNMGTPLTPTITLSIAPTTITLGQSATLTWTTMNAATCTASDGWSGNENTSGTQAVTPTATGTIKYTLTCTAPSGGSYSGGGGGTANMSVSLTVNAASAYSATNLVSDTATTGARNVDAHLKNAWGVVFGPTNPVWVANNHDETSTLYDGTGKPFPQPTPLVVNLPPTGAVTFDPTGVVFSGSATDFMVTEGANSGPARFIFTGEGGMIAGWAPNVDVANAVTMYPAPGGDNGGAIYKGLAIAKNGGASFLYATDFHNNRVDVFDAHFVKQALAATAFVDPKLPAGYAPYGIQAINNGTNGATQIYVTYAKQDADKEDNVNGAGLGMVNIYDPAGTLVKELVVTGGALNGPWGLALAPSDFGTLSGALLVGNFGDGVINGYDPAKGTFMGSVNDSTGHPIATPGLWGIAFGNDALNQPHNTLFMAAGPNDENNGEYARIDLGATAPTLGAAPVVTLGVPAGNLTGTVTLTATVQDTIAVAKVRFYANFTTLLGEVTTSPYTLQVDTTKLANGPVTLTAVGLDVNGNVGVSAAATGTVAN